MSSETPRSPTRRRALLAGSAGIGGLALVACGVRSEAQVSDVAANTSSTDCPKPIVPELTPQTTEGPYYFDAKQVRVDITEGMPGIPIEVVFNVVDPAGLPLADTRVDIWHCNAAGLYSGYAGQGDDRQADTTGETFLRGTQSTDAQGQARFTSVYPGWYRGRTTHIHFKVFHGDTAVLTCQFFVPDALSEYLYTNVDDYKRAELRDMLNSEDGIALQAGVLTHGNVRQDAERYVIELNVAVDPNATPSVDRPGSGGPPGGPGGPPPGEGGRSGRGGPPPMQARLTGEARVEAMVPKPVADTYRKP
ncbi:MAG: intradiol ring-cleavage dioxygenase [Pseudomonadota bacterium]|nr:intradiol ring-cleavage dioxygenase [Pseudomonadota bacterium]